MLCMAWRSWRVRFDGYKAFIAMEILAGICMASHTISSMILSLNPGTKRLLNFRKLLIASRVSFALQHCAIVGILICILFLVYEFTSCRKKRIYYLSCVFTILGVFDCIMLMASGFEPNIFPFMPCVPALLINNIATGSLVRGEFVAAYYCPSQILGDPHLLYCFVVIMFISLELMVFSIRDGIVYSIKYIVFLILIVLCATMPFMARNAGGLALLPVIYCTCVAVVHFAVMEPRYCSSLFTFRACHFKHSDNPCILFSRNQKLVDYNITASLLFPILKEKQSHNITLQDFFKEQLNIPAIDRSMQMRIDVEMQIPDEMLQQTRVKLRDPRFRRAADLTPTRIFNARLTPEVDDTKNVFAYSLILDDQTDIKKAFVSMKNVADIDQNSQLCTYYSLQQKIKDIDLHDYMPYTAIACTIAGINYIQTGVGRGEVDSIIRLVSGIIKSMIRGTDFAAFYNDQIIILIPDKAEVAKSLVKRFSSRLDKFNSTQFQLFLEYGINEKKQGSYSMEKVILYAQDQLISHQTQFVNDIHAHTMLSMLGQTEFEPQAHLDRLKDLARSYGQYLNLSPQDIGMLEKLALFHDIGKLSTPKDVFIKQEAFTQDDKILIGICCNKGYRLAMDTPMLKDIASLIYTHNEHYDGSGLPNGTQGENIPFLSRVFSVMEAYDVMIHNTPYKKAIPKQMALAQIQDKSGTQFDPAIATNFVSFIKEKS